MRTPWLVRTPRLARGNRSKVPKSNASFESIRSERFEELKTTTRDKLIVIHQVYIAHKNNRKHIRIKPSHSGSSPTRIKWTKAQRLDSTVLAIPL